jgi:hypothetical protein
MAAHERERGNLHKAGLLSIDIRESEHVKGVNRLDPLVVDGRRASRHDVKTGSRIVISPRLQQL